MVPLRLRFTVLITALVFATTLLPSWVASREYAAQMEPEIGRSTAKTVYQKKGSGGDEFVIHALAG